MIALRSSVGCGPDHRRHEPTRGVVEYDELCVREGHRAKEPRLCVAHRLDLPRDDLVAVDVRNAGVVSASKQVLVVPREREPLGRGAAELERTKRRGVPCEERVGGHHANLHDLRPCAARVEPGQGGRDQRSIGRHVQVVGHLTVREDVHRLPFGVRVRNAHEYHVAVVGAQSPQRPVGAVECQVSDALTLEQHLRLARFQVIRHQVAVAEVVRRVEECPRLWIEGQRSNAILHRTFHLLELGDGTVLERDGHEVRKAARIPDGGVQRPAVVAGDRARKGSQPDVGEVAIGGYRMLAHRGQVLPLEFVLPGDPVLPGLIELEAEHAAEVIRVGAQRSFVAPPPVEELLGPILDRQVAHEPCSVQIGICAHLEVDLGPDRDQAKRVVEPGVVAHHRAEHHLVVPTLGAAVTPTQPGFHEHRTALEVPAGSGISRCRQVVVDE